MTASVLQQDKATAKQKAVEQACSRIAPVWPLQNFVAVNPFLGLSHLHFAEAAQLMERVAHGPILPEAGYFLPQLASGAIGAGDIRAALAQHGGILEPEDPVEWLRRELQDVDCSEQILTVADWLDRKRGSNWTGFLVEEISKWCSSYFDLGQSNWRMPWKADSPYACWKQAASIDANAEIYGLAGFRAHVSRLPATAEESIAFALERMEVPEELAADFLHRQLLSVLGWSAYAAYLDRQGTGTGTLREILAIRLAYDSALLPMAGEWECETAQQEIAGGRLFARHIAQAAAENAFRTKVAAALTPAAPATGIAGRKALQAVFCIDVRSEVYRRALEAQSEEIETIGFAGFFGMPIGVETSERCPVLLKPQYQVEAKEPSNRGNGFGDRAKTAWKRLSGSASASFSSVEVGGAWFGAHLVAKSGRRKAAEAAQQELAWSIPLASRIELAAGALKNMSLKASELAKVVLLCGHGSSTENNPYGSSLDCGACGGHKGDVNARFAAALMNDAEVRQGLKGRGIAIPGDTIFAAALHNTTTDDVTVFGDGPLGGEELKRIKGWLEAASRRARVERSGGTAPQAERESRKRAADWSEVRPEWGLAGNAAFIAAPRWRTRSLNLKGRAFLHEYDAAADPDCSVLQLILTAPVVVASWINLQYYASRVNNGLFGSGNKVLHNVVGTFGVWEGNGGDLRTGLPLQSLHDGTKWMHEPLRLQVFVEAARDSIDAVLRANPAVENLVDNGWIHLMAIEGESVYERRGRGNWERTGGQNG